MQEQRKSFEQLTAEKAGCLEFAMNGFIRLYKEDEKRCECNDCVLAAKINKEVRDVERKFGLRGLT